MDSMFSIWWLLAAFLAGTYAGIFLIALMQVCGDVGQDGDTRGSSGSSGNNRHVRQAAA